ncbi:MFS transporter [Clostridium thermarum]|uniref:MFS transporter n=1 Tax=Clostridium thermarum TaxID=1716543 RepID=UPI001122B835|nr:MFS transporter [Clostridium thermarum]
MRVSTRISSLFNPYRGLSREIWVLFAARIINSMGAFIYPLLTLILTIKLEVPEDKAGLLISASGIAFMFSGVIGGKLTDLFGRKKIIITLNLIGACLYIAAAFVPVSINMIPMIIAAGFFMGMSDPASSALIADITEPKTRDGAYSLFYMGMNIGFAVSPTIGGLLLKNHLNLLFFIDGFTAILSMLLIAVFIPESFNKNQEIVGEDRELEKHVEGSTLSILIKRPILIFFALIMFGYNFVYAQWSYLYPMQVEQSFVGQGAKIYGRLVSFNALIVIFLTPVITKLLSSKKSIRRIFYGGILYAAGFGSLAFGGNIYFYIFSTAIITFGEITVTISSSPFLANHTPASHRGRIGSVLPIIMGAGQILGPGVMGVILKLTGINGAWFFTGGIMSIFALFTLLLDRYENRKKVEVNTTEVA